MRRTKYVKAITVLVMSAILATQSNDVSLPGMIHNKENATAYAAVSAQKVSINKKSISLDEGKTQTLKATVSPSNAANKKVTWTSSNKKVAVVSSAGKVKAIKAGTAVITAKTSNGKKAECTVTVKKVNKEVTSITLNYNTLALDIEDTSQLQATVQPANAENAELTWSSEDESIVYVDSEGTLIPVSAGTTTVTAGTDNGITASCSVTVTEEIVQNAEIMLYETTLNLNKGDVYSLLTYITADNKEDYTITWVSSDGNIADVTDTGKVVAYNVGTATITASLSNGNSASCEVVVTEKEIEAASIKLSRTSLALPVGDSIIISAEILPANASDKRLSWRSSDPGVAIVGSDGSVVAKAAGSATITVTATNGVSAECSIIVSTKIIETASIKFNTTSATLNIGDTAALIATVLPDNASDKSISWSSSNPNVASVGSDGSVIAKAKGTAVITASLKNGVKATCSVTVNDLPRRVSLSAGTYEIKLKGSELSLDVNGAGTSNGTNVQVYNSNKSNAQIWALEVHSDNTVSFISQCAKDKVLDVMRTNNSSTGAIASGCNVDIYDHNDVPAQSFYLEQFNDGSYLIRLYSNTNLVVQATAASSGANVIIGNYDENNSLQRWTITSASAIQNNTPVEQRRTAYIYNTGGAGLFVRDQASSSGNKVGGFAEGQEITIIGEIQNGWYKVEGADRNTGAVISGYSHGDYITFTKATDSSLAITVRTTAPATNDYHYYSNQNIYYASGYGMPNCTAYAWGRIWEIYGAQLPSNGFRNNAYTWWDDNIKIGKYKYGSSPRIGAIAVWASSLPGSGGCGHVAVVEKMEGDKVYVSQSVYNGVVFKYDQIGNTSYLRGYIYVDQPNY